MTQSVKSDHHAPLQPAGVVCMYICSHWVGLERRQCVCNHRVDHPINAMEGGKPKPYIRHLARQLRPLAITTYRPAYNNRCIE